MGATKLEQIPIFTRIPIDFIFINCLISRMKRFELTRLITSFKFLHSYWTALIKNILRFLCMEIVFEMTRTFNFKPPKMVCPRNFSASNCTLFKFIEIVSYTILWLNRHRSVLPVVVLVKELSRQWPPSTGDYTYTGTFVLQENNTLYEWSIGKRPRFGCKTKISINPKDTIFVQDTRMVLGHRVECPLK